MKTVHPNKQAVNDKGEIRKDLITKEIKINDNKKKFLPILEFHLGNITSACNQMNISRGTFYDWVNNDDDFKKQVDEIGEIALDFVESKLFQKIDGIHSKTDDGIVYKKEPDTTAIIFYLKTKGRKRGYIERTEIELNDKRPDLSELSTIEIQKLLAENGE